METLMAIIIGILFTIGVYLVLSKSLLRIIFGTSVIAHGTHLLIITMGGLKTGGPPLLDGRAVSYTDPLPQALILTAIVINFATTAFLLVLAYRAYSALGTENMEHLRGINDNE
jgi:multicomponent Na+:H+ antiporter subunit C